MNGQIIWNWWFIKQFSSASTVQKVQNVFGLAVILLYSFVKFTYTDLNLFLVRKAEVVVFLAVSERNKNTVITVS